MPPFVYTNAPNPYAPSIGELLAHGGDAAARAAETIGAAQARAREVSGQAWGQAAVQAGQVPQQIQQQQDAVTTRQLRQTDLAKATLETGQMQRAVDGQKLLATLIQKHTTADPYGVPVVDHQAIANDLSTAGYPDAAEKWLGTTAANADNVERIKGLQRQTGAAIATAIGRAAKAATSPQDFLSHVGLLHVEGIIPPEVVQQVTQQVQQGGDQGWTAFQQRTVANADALAAPVKLGKDDKIIAGVSGATIADNSDPDEGAYTINGQRFRKDGTQIGAAQPLQTAPSYEQKNVLVKGKPATVSFDAHTGRSLDAAGNDVSPFVTPIPSAAQVSITAGTLSDAALEQSARAYLAKGRDALPTGMGAGAVKQRTDIMNLAAKIDPTAALAVNQAVYKSDSANLTNLTKTEGTLSAFEKTAGKNLDQFLELSKGIPDTGVPWLNTPVRLLNQQAVGSANMAAINAARDVALREIARVTNDPKLSGSLTDSARAEVLGLSPQNATFGQIRAVAKVLKQDMANVHQGINEQIQTVKAGMGSNPSAPTVAPPPAAGTGAPTYQDYLKSRGGQ